MNSRSNHSCLRGTDSRCWPAIATDVATTFGMYCRGKHNTSVGALTIRIGFWGPLYSIYIIRNRRSHDTNSTDRCKMCFNVIFCYIMLHCILLHYIICAVLHVLLHCVLWHCVILHCVLVHYVQLHDFILHYTILSYAILHDAIFHDMVPFYTTVCYIM